MSVKREILNGVFWTAVSKYSGIILSLFVSAVLARLITPEAYGIIGIAVVFISFFSILGDIGIGPAIIQRKNLTKDDISSIHTWTIYLGLVLTVAFCICAPFIADLYSNTKLKYVCIYLSLSILFSCANTVPINLYYKQKKFKIIAITSLIIQIFVGAIAVIYALLGGGVYALVLQSILSNFIMMVIYWKMSGIGFKLIPNTSSLKKIAKFSTYQFLFNLINYFSRNSDKLIIGKTLGLSSLGYYDKSYRLMMLPLQQITFVISPVLLPVFSEFQDNLKVLGKKYLKIYSTLSYISFPVSIILFICSPELIYIIFGSQWGPSIQPFRILSLSLSMQILTSTTGNIFQAIDSTKRLFLSGLMGAILTISAFAIGGIVFKSLTILCWSYVISQVFNAIQCFYMLFSSLKVTFIEAVKPLIKPILISIILYFIFGAASPIFNKFESIVSLAYKVIIGLISYFSLIYIIGGISPKTLLNSLKSARQ